MMSTCSYTSTRRRHNIYLSLNISCRQTLANNVHTMFDFRNSFFHVYYFICINNVTVYEHSLTSKWKISLFKNSIVLLNATLCCARGHVEGRLERKSCGIYDMRNDKPSHLCKTHVTTNYYTGEINRII